MKKIFLVGVLGFGLILGGCTENKTGLQKNVVNTAFEKCNEYLASSLKSPSSLRVSGGSVIVQQPDLSDVYDVFGSTIIKSNKISEIARDGKTRYREMLVIVSYEAQNSFGVYLGGTYQCKYLYELNNNESSPKPLNTYLVTLKSDGENIDMEGIHIPIAEFTGSNFTLNKSIKTIMSSANSGFNQQDEQMYIDLVKKFKSNEAKRKTTAIESNELSRVAREATEAASEATAAALEAMAAVGY